MDFLKDILRGALIGVANVIPGVSGGTMAVSMGIYDKIIEAVTNLRKEFKKSFMTLLPYGIGIVIGVIGLAFLIEMLFEMFQIPTVMCFLGLILGGLPVIIKKVDNEEFKVVDLISFSIFVCLIVFLTIFSSCGGSVASVSGGFVTMLLMLFLGFVSAGTMVVPGVSGSMILMMLGYYEFIIKTINSFIKSAVAFNISDVFMNMKLLVPFGIGVLIGIFVIAKVIDFLLKKYTVPTYWGIIGLIVASPFAIIYPVSFTNIGFGTIIASVITFAIGFVTAMKLSK